MRSYSLTALALPCSARKELLVRRGHESKMTTKASDEETCQAVLDFVTEGNYPESGSVAASEISASALSKELELISKARDQVEVSAVFFPDDNPCPY